MMFAPYRHIALPTDNPGKPPRCRFCAAVIRKTKRGWIHDD